MEHARPLRRSRSAVYIRMPSLRASKSFNNVKQALKRSARSDDSKQTLMSMTLVEVPPVVGLRPCQDAYFLDGTPALVKDRDADIFKKHENNAQSYAKFKPCFPKVCVVERGASDDEGSLDGTLDDSPDMRNDASQRLSPTGVLMHSVYPNSEAAQQQPLPIPPRTTSLACRRRFEEASGTDNQSRSETTSRALPPLPEGCRPPPVPEKSKLRPPPATKHNGTRPENQASTIHDASGYPVGTQGVSGTRIDSLKTPNWTKIEYHQKPQVDISVRELNDHDMNDHGTNDQGLPRVTNYWGAKRNFRQRLSSLRTASRNFTKDQQQKPHKSQDEDDFEEGKKTLYMAIYAARVKKAEREAKTRGEDSFGRVAWLKFNSDLAADARVTANGEDLRVSSQPRSRVRTEFRACTWVEFVEETGHIILIGPAGYGALTLTEQWLGGCDQKYERQAWEAITDESYPYIGIAQSSRQGKWILHLAQQQPRKQMIEDRYKISGPRLPRTHAYTALEYLSIVEEARSLVESASSSHRLSTEQSVGKTPKESSLIKSPKKRSTESQNIPAEVERSEKQAEKAAKGHQSVVRRLEHLNETFGKYTAAVIAEPTPVGPTPASSKFSIPRKPVPSRIR